MSCFFRLGEHDVWNPSNNVAKLFVGQAQAIAETFGMETGVGLIVDDESEIDPVKFVEFVTAMLRKHGQSNNLALRTLVEGFLNVSLALIERAGLNVNSGEREATEPLKDRVEELSRNMPTG